MPLYNSILEYLVMPAGDAIIGTTFMQELRNWRKLEQLTPQEIESLQQEKLIRLLEYASSSIPFYQQLHLPLQKNCEECLQAFPVMYKSVIRKNLRSLMLDDPAKLVCEKSSGSSGIQGEVYMTRKEQFAALAAQTHLWEWAGYRLGYPLLQLGMTPKRKGMKGVKDKILRTTYQQAFTIDEAKTGQALRHFSNKDGFFGGYASGLYAYACFSERLGIKADFKAVISWGDKMFDHYRKKIETVFNTSVFDIYGTTEGFVISGQCPHGNHHILTPHVYLELLDKNGNEVAPGEIGQVVVTRLDAFAMPLIRYYLGDLAIKASPSEHCTCGRPYPMLRKIIGRDTDIVHTPSGKYLIVHFFTGIFEHIPEIRQFRVVQRVLQGIEIEYIPHTGFNPAILEFIEGRIQEYIQEPFFVTFSEVNHISATPSGKPQIIQSHIKNH